MEGSLHESGWGSGMNLSDYRPTVTASQSRQIRAGEAEIRRVLIQSGWKQQGSDLIHARDGEVEGWGRLRGLTAKVRLTETVHLSSAGRLAHPRRHQEFTVVTDTVECMALESSSVSPAEARAYSRLDAETAAATLAALANELS